MTKHVSDGQVYRRLSEQEINELMARGCVAVDWTPVAVPDGPFVTSRLSNVGFSGDVCIGRLD